MKSDWIIGVISDLRVFAELNGMDQLAEKLAEAVDVAKADLGEEAEQPLDADKRVTALGFSRPARPRPASDGQVIAWRPRQRKRVGE